MKIYKVEYRTEQNFGGEDNLIIAQDFTAAVKKADSRLKRIKRGYADDIQLFSIALQGKVTQ